MKKNKGFFTLLFIFLAIILIFISYYAIQQRQTTRSKAAETTGRCVDITPSTNGRCVLKTTITPEGPNNKNVQLKLKISLQGIRKASQEGYPDLPPEVKQNTIAAKVVIVDEKNNKREKDGVVFTLNNDDRTWIGTADFEALDISRRYYVLIKSEKHIQKKICDKIPKDPSIGGGGYYSCEFGKFVNLQEGLNEFDFSGIRLLSGDLPISNNQNGVIDAEDLGVLKNLIDKPDSELTDEDLRVADLDLNGLVEAHDWSLMIESLEVKYDEK